MYDHTVLNGMSQRGREREKEEERGGRFGLFNDTWSP